MKRRPDLGLLSLLPALTAFVAFGVLRVDAPVSLIGLLFDRPEAFALVSTVVAVAGAGLLFLRPVELRVARLLAPSREPATDENERLRRLLAPLGRRSGMATDRLILRVQDSEDPNAGAGTTHLLFVTTAALRRTDPELEGLLAHELAHHRGLHPLAVAMVWWLSLPGEALAVIFRALRRFALLLNRLARPLALVARGLLIAWQASVMWLHYIGKLLASWAARVSEHAADGAAAKWGYADDLVRLYASIPDSAPDGLLARLLAEHPPMQRRLARLTSGDSLPDGPTARGSEGDARLRQDADA